MDLKSDMSIKRILECFRMAGVFIGFWLAYSDLSNPTQAFHYLAVFVVVSIAGVTAVESLMFSKQGAEASGYSDPGPYQRQSGLNNAAVAIVSVVVFALNWGTRAETTTCLVLLVFLILSSFNHAYSGLRNGNGSWRCFTRPLGTLILLIAVIPFMIRALAATP